MVVSCPFANFCHAMNNVMLEAGISQPEVIKPMIEPAADDGDAQYGHVS